VPRQGLNATTRTTPTVPELFAAQAANTPKAVAVLDGDRDMTYRELDVRSSRLAHHLRGLGVSPEVMVGLCMPRSADILVALLGILKAGGGYVPLDPAYPRERLAFMQADAGVRVVVTKGGMIERLPAGGLQPVLLDADAAAIAGEPSSAPAVRLQPQNAAYILYTSGSTGTPKGVVVTHGNIVRLVRNTNYVTLTAEDVVLLMAPLSFDASTFELWGALLNGARLVVYPDGPFDIARLKQVVATAKVSVLWLTAAVFHQVVDEDASALAGVRTVLAGGDVLSASHVRRHLTTSAGGVLINGYGPTECTTFSACFRMRAADDVGDSVPIGPPISNTQLYILDAAQQPVPAGVAGELYIAGEGLSRGYLGRPALTAERFVANPHGPPGSRMYRSGDRARWRPDGVVEFLGRVDAQVKLRGFRIEPGEIEACLLRHGAVAQVVVIARQDQPDDKRLVAYVVLAAGATVDAAALRRHVAATLPDYMVPAAVVVLEGLPLTANGKLDRSRLPAPVAARTAAAPATLTEKRLSALWSQLLGCPDIGRDDHFFALGGHSLLATQLVSRIRDAFAIDLPLHLLFEHAVLAEQAAIIDRSQRGCSLPPIEPCADRAAAALSFAQQRLWFLNQLDSDSSFYNTPFALRLRGWLNKPALHAALQDVIDRHEILRTALRNEDGEPRQVVLPEVRVPLLEIDLRSVPPTGREQALLARAQAEARVAFSNLGEPPLLRAVLFSLAADEHALLLTMHHIITDGWSLGVLSRELGHFYKARCGQETADLPKLPIQYADFAAWQRRWLTGEVLERQLAYWRGQLAGATPMLALPTDRPRPAVQMFRGSSILFEVDRATRDALHRIGRVHGATLFMTLFAAFAALLHRYSGQTDIVVGSPIANRRHSELEELLGFFVNTLALRVDLGGAPSFLSLLDRVRRTTLDAYTHQDLPFEMLVDELQPQRDLSRNPLFQVMFALQNMPGTAAEIEGLQLSPIHVDRNAALFDIVLDIWDTGEGLRGLFEFDVDLFERATAERMILHLKVLLDAIARDPECPIDKLALLDPDERRQLLGFANGPSIRYPVDQSLIAAFEAQVDATPRRVAAVADDVTIDFADLNRDANRLGHLLRALDVRPGTPVGILVPRGLAYLTAMLGVTKSGGAFLPLDTAYPAGRLRYMLEDSGTGTLVTTAAGLAQLGHDELPRTLHDIVLMGSSAGEELALLPRVRLHTASALARQPTCNPPIANSARDVLYVLYTSGSTGLPKGAMVRHDGALNHIFAEFRLLSFHADTAFLQSAPASSDISVWQCIASLLIGARTVFADHETICNPPALLELIRKQQVTLIELVPAVLDALLSHADSLSPAERALPDLEWAMVTGEAAPAALVERWFKIWPDVPLVNAYGPTEAADDVCQHVLRGPLPATQTFVPIGQPLDNLSVLVLDQHGALTPIAVPGQICVGGIAVGAGYWRQPARTAAAFVPNPLAGETFGGTIYLTGDLGRWRADGSLEFVGRLDQQVKIRGFRVELGEIETALGRHPLVREALILDYQAGEQERELVAHLLMRPEAQDSGELAREQVAQWKDLHDDSYAHTHLLEQDPAFNTIGWDSTFTGQPLSVSEMNEAVDNAVGRILELAPRSLLEIGCGTGLLLYRLVPHCSRYCGTDLSATAIRQLADNRGRLPIAGLENVELLVRPADDFSGFATASFDTIVLNSVVQYFPNVGYLHGVLREAVRLCAPGGAVFIGDVRSLPQLRSYHAAVECFKAADTTNCGELSQRIEVQRSRDQELVLAPQFFLTLARELQRIGRVTIRPKRGQEINELTQFRYDVVLQLDVPAPAAVASKDVWQDWPDLGWQVSDIRAHLETARPAHWGLRHVANSRLGAQRRVDRWLSESPPTATVGELRALLLAAAAAPAVDPEVLWQLGAVLPYRIDIRIEPDSTSGDFAVLFSRQDAAEIEIDAGMWESSAAARAAVEVANNPLQEKSAGKLVPALRSFIKATLPDHMIPRSFVVLSHFPLAPSGKIDRRALPPPHVDSGHNAEFIAPRTPTEQTIQAIWASVLGIASPSVADNFFSLGGHSLKATQVVSRIKQLLHRDVSLRDIFNYPTIEELAALLDGQQERTLPESIPRTPEVDSYPTSRAQQRLWVLSQMGAAAAYNMATCLRLRGPLREKALVGAFAALVQRHEALRTSFAEIAGELRYRVAVSVPDVVEVVDVSDEPDPLAVARDMAIEHARREFDLTRAPLLSVRLVRLGPADHLLLFNVHHIISDGWSLDVVVREVMVLYEAAAEDRSAALAPLRVQYRDYVAWQRQRWPEIQERQGAYWRSQLDAGAAPLRLTAAAPRPPVKTYRGRRHRASFPVAVSQALGALAQDQRVSLFMLLVAIVKVLLHRYSGASDISVGCPVAGRNHPDLEGQIGFFVNTLVLRDRIDGGRTFRDFLGDVKETIIAAHGNQDYPFDQLVVELNPPRDPSRNPLFDVMVAMQNTANVVPRIANVEISSVGLDHGYAQFDLLWSFTETSDGLHLDLHYNCDLFSSDSASRLTDALNALTLGVIAAPQTPLGRLPLLSAAERRALIDVVPRSSEPGLHHRSLVHWFESQAAATPDAVAVIDGPRELTYAQLNACANQIGRTVGRMLESVGAPEAALVGLSMHRSATLVAAILGILKSGAAYVPIDPDIPALRQQFILRDARIAVLVTESNALDLLPAFLPARYDVDIATLLQAPDPGNPDPAAAASTPAYVIYTSGSTGDPKGVVVTHGNVVRLFTATQAWFKFGPDDVWSLFHSYAFDFSVWEIWGALLHGGRLVIVPYEISRAPEQLYELLVRKGVTVLNQTPSAFRQLQQAEAAHSEPLPLALRYIIFGGEALEPAQLRPWFDRHGDASPILVNMYGITETTVHVTYRPLTASDALQMASPIGVPIPDLYLYVLDEHLEPVPPYLPGEIYVGGAGLASGYLNRDVLTSQRFIADPFRPSSRLYRTGDRVCRRGDGEIEYLGRADDQIKIRGFRIEPGEIAAQLSRHPAVADAVVVPRRRDAETMLVAYYVAADGATDAGSLRRHLQQLLPPYMVPAFFVALARLPLTANGKLDHRELPDPLASTSSLPDVPAPRSGLEARILKLWCDLLGHHALGPDDNVFEHGAHSMLAVQARNQLQAWLGRDIPVVMLFQCPTPAALAAALSRPEDDEPHDLEAAAQQRAAQRRQVDRQQAGRRPAARQREQ
jgi:amino acid adenylation domain-containing protein